MTKNSEITHPSHRLRFTVYGLLVLLGLVLVLSFMPRTTVITYRVNNINGAPNAIIQYTALDQAPTQAAGIQAELPWQTTLTLKRPLWRAWFSDLPALQVSAEVSNPAAVPNVLIECEIIVDDAVLVRNRANDAVVCFSE